MYLLHVPYNHIYLLLVFCVIVCCVVDLLCVRRKYRSDVTCHNLYYVVSERVY